MPQRKIPAAKKTKFCQTLLTWYTEHGRDLPWRKTDNPYHVLVSEMMLQQTQVDRVILLPEGSARVRVKEVGKDWTAEVQIAWSALGIAPFNERVRGRLAALPP